MFVEDPSSLKIGFCPRHTVSPSKSPVFNVQTAGYVNLRMSVNKQSLISNYSFKLSSD